jgi:coenzyme F420-0:L-glutamate ligase/coenzyme F420-1:gamma-L-glutamate ligase
VIRYSEYRIPGSRFPEVTLSLPQITLTAVPDIPLIRAGDDLAAILLDRLQKAALTLQDGDVMVLCQKIVSKAEGRAVRLDQVQPSEEARALAAESGKNPHLVELILRESRSVLRTRPHLIVSEHRLGWICANAGIDRSNVAQPEHDGVVLLLPADPDQSARGIRARLNAASGADVAVVINDTHGRPFRNGAVGVAIGVAGLAPLSDLRGQPDLFGYQLQTSILGTADEIASAASLLMGQADEGRPAILVRGAPVILGAGSARDLQRPEEKDLFR